MARIPKILRALVLALCVTGLTVAALAIGAAGGRGSIASMPSSPTATEQRINFVPRYAFAYVEGRGDKRATWIVLTEKEPPLGTWAGSKDRIAARQQWCQKENAAFIAVKLNASDAVDLYSVCPPGAAFSNTEMVSSWNGLDSVVVQIIREGNRLKGSLRGGVGNCPVSGKSAYCVALSDYSFDAPMLP
jgi:hypothetical protein